MTLFGAALALTLAACSRTEQPSPAAEDARPNILLIVADDLGFTDLGAFGSEIPTPNLDALAYDGVRLTNLHTARACQQMRAMLMSSRGVSSVIEQRPSRADGERDNRLTLSVATLPELLRDAGYATYMAGKWDLGREKAYAPAARGFDRSFAMLGASASHFAEPFWSEGVFYEEDGVHVPIEDLPEDFYTTRNYTDKLLEFLSDHDPQRPWFAFVPYTAPHWPLQLPEEWLDRNLGRYDAGYDALRAARTRRAAELGISAGPNAIDLFRPIATPWSELDEESRARYSRAQEILAGMVEYLDMSVGRIVAYLEESGQLDDTVILFMSDHGAAASEYGIATDGTAPATGPGAFAATRDNRLENFGRPGSFVDHGRGFAEAASAPLKYFKSNLAEGGIRAAAFVHYPRALGEPRIGRAFVTVMDILPTFLDIAGSAHPGAGEYKGREILPPLGRSFWPWLTGAATSVHGDADVAGWSAGETGAIIRGDFKAINHPPPGGMGNPPWQLYDLSVDPGEHNDLAAEQPDLLDDLIAEWEANWQ